MRKLGALLPVLAAVLVLPGVAVAEPKPDTQTRVQLLAINDLHGHLAPNTPGTIQVGCCNPVKDSAGVQTGWTQKVVPAGGIAYLAAHIKALRATNPNTITVGAGDMIGASPLVSALFHDEPTIESLNSIGMDVSGVGNHEFDEGVDELLRMRYGDQRGGDGCHPVDGCQDGTPFGARSSSTWRRTSSTRARTRRSCRRTRSGRRAARRSRSSASRSRARRRSSLRAPSRGSSSGPRS
jgi:5'-nucleotidase